MNQETLAECKMVIDELGEWALKDKLQWWDPAYQHYYIPPSSKKETSLSMFTSEALKNYIMRQFVPVDNA